MPINPLLQDQEKDQNKTNADNSGGTPNQGQGAQISSGESVNITPGSTSGGQISGGSANKGNSQGPVGSGNFTNLNQYVNANKDQGAGLGAAVAQGVQKSANTALQSLGGASKEFNTATQAQGVDASQYTPDKIQGIVNTAYNDPNALKDSDINTFTTAQQKAAALASGTDAGPKSLTELNSYQNAKNQLGTAEQNVGLTGTEAGRQTLLQEQFKRPDYTKGQNSLDQLLTQNAPGNKERFDSLRKGLLGQYGLAGQDAAAIQAANDTRQSTIQGTQDIANNVQSAVGGVLDPYSKELQALPGQLNQQQADALANTKQQLKDYLTQQYGSKVFGANVDDIVNAMVTPKSTIGSATLQNSINSDQLNRLQALNKLAGKDPNLLGDTQLGNVSTSPFSAGVNQDSAAGQKIIQQRVQQYSADVAQKANAGLNASATIYGQTKAGADAVNYFLSRANVGMNDPKSDAQEGGKLLDALQSQLNAINQYRGQYGFGDIGVYNDRIEPVKKEILDNMMGQFSNGVIGLTEARKTQILNDRLKDPNFVNAVNVEAKVLATYRLLQNLHDNPTLLTPSTQTALQNIPNAANPAAPSVGPKMPPGQYSL